MIYQYRTVQALSHILFAFVCSFPNCCLLFLKTPAQPYWYRSNPFSNNENAHAEPIVDQDIMCREKAVAVSPIELRRVFETEKCDDGLRRAYFQTRRKSVQRIEIS
jgi:hypothetical protein